MFPFGKVKARKIGTSLIVAYPEAMPPLVWKFDLEKNHSFTLALQGEEGDWELGVASPKGDFYQVARFLAREDAEKAFARTQNTLMNGGTNLWRLLGMVSMILVVVVALVVVGSFARTVLMHGESRSLETTAGALMPEGSKEGMPQSADQVLTPPP
jgi:hypothetical protein